MPVTEPGLPGRPLSPESPNKTQLHCQLDCIPAGDDTMMSTCIGTISSLNAVQSRRPSAAVRVLEKRSIFVCVRTLSNFHQF